MLASDRLDLLRRCLARELQGPPRLPTQPEPALDAVARLCADWQHHRLADPTPADRSAAAWWVWHEPAPRRGYAWLQSLALLRAAGDRARADDLAQGAYLGLLEALARRAERPRSPIFAASPPDLDADKVSGWFARTLWGRARHQWREDRRLAGELPELAAPPEDEADPGPARLLHAAAAWALADLPASERDKAWQMLRHAFGLEEAPHTRRGGKDRNAPRAALDALLLRLHLLRGAPEAVQASLPDARAPFCLGPLPAVLPSEMERWSSGVDLAGALRALPPGPERKALEALLLRREKLASHLDAFGGEDAESRRARCFRLVHALGARLGGPDRGPLPAAPVRACHPRVRQGLRALAAGAPATPRARRLLRALHRCPDCRDWWQEHSLLRALPEPRRGRARRWLPLLALAAGALLALWPDAQEPIARVGTPPVAYRVALEVAEPDGARERFPLHRDSHPPRIAAGARVGVRLDLLARVETEQPVRVSAWIVDRRGRPTEVEALQVGAEVELLLHQGLVLDGPARVVVLSGPAVGLPTRVDPELPCADFSGTACEAWAVELR